MKTFKEFCEGYGKESWPGWAKRGIFGTKQFHAADMGRAVSETIRNYGIDPDNEEVQAAITNLVVVAGGANRANAARQAEHEPVAQS